MEKEKYVATEVRVHLENSQQGKAFGLLLANQMSENTIGGNNFLVNRLGSDPYGNYYADFIGPGENLKVVEAAVDNFLNEFMVELRNENLLEEFMMLLEQEQEEKMPVVKGYDILSTAHYQN